MNNKVISLKREIKDDYNYRESLKTLRTNIQFCGSNLHTIMFTSALPDEGKSDVAFSVAASLAQIGKKVVFIDADIRKSVLVSRYQLDGDVNGLSQYLSGQKSREDIIYQTNYEGFSVIFAGPYSPNPAELLEEDLFSELIKSLKDYDYVIIDTPPMANLIDGAIVASNCDGAIIVIEQGAVSYRLEQKVKSQLDKTGCRVLGVVLNKVDLSQNGYYGKYGKYGKYGRYGRYGKYDKYGAYSPYEKAEAMQKGQ